MSYFLLFLGNNLLFLLQLFSFCKPYPPTEVAAVPRMLLELIARMMPCLLLAIAVAVSPLVPLIPHVLVAAAV